MILYRCKIDNQNERVFKMRSRRNNKKKTNKVYWFTGATCTILATGVFWFTAPLSGDTTHSNQDPDQTELVQAQKDRQGMIQDKLESINKEYKRKAKDKKVKDSSDEIETVEETEAQETYLQQPETETETSQEGSYKSTEALEMEIKAMGGKPKSWEELIYEENVPHELLLLAAMDYDTELRDLYLSVVPNDPRGYVTAQNNTAAVIWNAGCVNSQYRGVPGNESLQDFYMNVEETESEQGGTITHQGIKVTYKTIWLNPGIPATGSLYQITSVEKIN